MRVSLNIGELPIKTILLVLDLSHDIPIWGSRKFPPPSKAQWGRALGVPLPRGPKGREFGPLEQAKRGSDGTITPMIGGLNLDLFAQFFTLLGKNDEKNPSLSFPSGHQTWLAGHFPI